MLITFCNNKKKNGYKIKEPENLKVVTIIKEKKISSSSIKNKLFECLYNKAHVEDYLREKCYDICCKPITEISSEDIEASYKILHDIEQCILYNIEGDLFQLSQQYFLKIPDFLSSMKSSIINTHKKLKQKSELLLEIEYFKHIFTSFPSTLPSIELLEKDSEIYDLILSNITSATNLSTQLIKVQVENIFSITDNKNSSIRGNRQLLWLKANPHCFPYMLSKGFISQPIISPSSPYEFNKGFYFYDNIYSLLPDTGNAILLLCDVALGNNLVKFHEDIFFQDSAYDSVKGFGKIYSSNFKEHQDTKIATDFKIKDDCCAFPFTLYSVYDSGQISPKFIVKFSLE